MSKIYISKDTNITLDDFIDSNYDYTDILIPITLNKVYYKIHTLLLLMYPKVLANLINEYITDILTFNLICVYTCFSGDLKPIDKERPHSTTDEIVINVISKDVMINFTKYTINHQLSVNRHGHAFHCYNAILNLKPILYDGTVNYLSYFETYLNKFYNKSLFNIKPIEYNFGKKVNIINVYNYRDEFDHKTFKNTIIIIHVILRFLKKLCNNRFANWH